MSYTSIRRRLGLGVDYGLETLVKSHREFFRPGLPPAQLEARKTAIRDEKGVPEWIKELEGEARSRAIDALSSDDYFRNQFRAGTDRSKASLDVLKWGLDHIERLRQIDADVGEAKAKRFMAWTPLASVIVALLSVLASAFVAYRANDFQYRLKLLELTARPKLEGYTSLCRAADEMFRGAANSDKVTIGRAANEFTSTLSGLYPFLKSDCRSRTSHLFSQFRVACDNAAATSQPSTGVQWVDVDRFRQELADELDINLTDG